jgi:hypothetical protein
MWSAPAERSGDGALDRAAIQSDVSRHIGIDLSGETIHEIHEAELFLFAQFRVISWIVLV